MEIYRTEFFIPVNRASKTFEQHERESFQTMQQVLSKRVFKFDDNWYNDMFKRMDFLSAHWDEEIKKMRLELFKLKDVDESSSSMQKMTLTTTTSSNTSNAITSPTPQPTCTSDVNQQNLQLKTTSFNEQIKTYYNREADGLVHFKVHIDVTDYKPEDIKVTALNNRLSISAKHEVRTATSMSYKEFSRTFDLPSNIDAKLLKCTLTNDGVLSLDAPVQSPEYDNAIEYNRKTEVLPISATPIQQNVNVCSNSTTSTTSQICSTSQSLSVLGKTGVNLITVGGKKKVHVEIEMTDEYSEEEIKVEFKNQTIYIFGRHEEKTASRSSFREFHKEFGILDNVESSTFVKKIVNKTLIVEVDVI